MDEPVYTAASIRAAHATHPPEVRARLEQSTAYRRTVTHDIVVSGFGIGLQQYWRGIDGHVYYRGKPIGPGATLADAKATARAHALTEVYARFPV